MIQCLYRGWSPETSSQKSLAAVYRRLKEVMSVGRFSSRKDVENAVRSVCCELELLRYSLSLELSALSRAVCRGRDALPLQAACCCHVSRHTAE